MPWITYKDKEIGNNVEAFKAQMSGAIMNCLRNPDKEFDGKRPELVFKEVDFKKRFVSLEKSADKWAGLGWKV